MPIPASQASASNVEFTNGALRYRAHLVVENMELRVVDGEADGGLLGLGAERGNDAGSRDDRTLSRPIIVDQRKGQSLRRTEVQRVGSAEEREQRGSRGPGQQHYKFSQRCGREGDCDGLLHEPVAQ